MSRILKTLAVLGVVATVAACTQPTEEIIIVPEGGVVSEPVFEGKL